MTKLNEHERKVLTFLSKQGEDFNCFPFSPLARRVGLNIREVRRACRSLKRKGLTEFHAGLFTEDGEVAGSGYCASDAGRAALQSIQPVEEKQS